MTVVDAHQHLWNLEKVEYPWLTPALGAINRTFLETELEPQLVQAGVDRTVLVQAANSVEDSDFMLAVAERWPRAAGVVGWVPLLDPAAAAAELERRGALSAFVGIRHLVHDEPDPDWVVRPEVIESLGAVAAYGLSFDLIGVLPRHLEHAVTLARALPQLRIVIDHLGTPPIGDDGWEPWSSLLAAAAEHPNVFAKVSGLTTIAGTDDWTTARLQPYIDRSLELFGPDRLMIGGDWPVSTLSGRYAEVWRQTSQAFDGLSDSDRAAVLGGTATNFYRLDVDLDSEGKDS